MDGGGGNYQSEGGRDRGEEYLVPGEVLYTVSHYKQEIIACMI